MNDLFYSYHNSVTATESVSALEQLYITFCFLCVWHIIVFRKKVNTPKIRDTYQLHQQLSHVTFFVNTLGRWQKKKKQEREENSEGQ